ncbi:MAG: ABC transporter ATP-binding protein, partial [Rhodobacteraceae bacterium]|nr:ABC transporter ATP-binding protein [Paracoccaceae bacterium]
EEFEGNARHLFVGANDIDLRVSRVNTGSSTDNLNGSAVTVGFEPENAIVLPYGPLAGA